MYVKCNTAHLDGINGQLIEVEVDISNGLPQFDIVGLPGSALKEAKERVRAAIKNSGFTFPQRRITVNLAPAHVRKEGSYFDLVIALGILMADEQLHLSPESQEHISTCLIIGELALDGSIRSNTGILPLVLAAKDQGIQEVYLPEHHAREASVVKGMHIYPVMSLTQLVQLVQLVQHDKKRDEQQNNSFAHSLSCNNPSAPAPSAPPSTAHESIPLDDIYGQEHVKRAFEIAACGSHHMLMTGPPGSGKTLLAKSFSSLLPPLNYTQSLEVTRIYSVAGQLKSNQGLLCQKPFRAPHHSVTLTGMVGGGLPVKPGEISLGHHGVLFLDELLEFKREVIEALREPLEEGRISLIRGNQRYTFPAQFLLIGALNPCPCGYFGYENQTHTCSCTATQVERYQQKLSGPLFDRIDLHIEVPLIPLELLQDASAMKLDEEYKQEHIEKRISEALSYKKYRKGAEKPNGQLTASEVKSECKLTPAAKELLNLAYQRLSFSMRGYHKLLKIARSIADLNQTERIDDRAISEAIQYRSLDRQKTGRISM